MHRARLRLTKRSDYQSETSLCSQPVHLEDSTDQPVQPKEEEKQTPQVA